MNLMERQAAIVDRLQADGQVDVVQLALGLDTSEVTIRRDLEQLAQAGVLRRTRGGAVSLHMRGEGLPFTLRTLDGADVKERLAAAVSELLRDGEAVAVDSGTTGAAVALGLAARRLTVMPFSIQALNHLAASPAVTVLLPGGTVNAEEGSITGPLAQSALRALRFDTAVLSCCGVSEVDGITAYDLQDAATKQAMVAAARRTILVAAGEKFAHSAMAVVCGLADVDVLVTDSSAPADTLERLRGAGVQVVVVPGP